MKKLILTLGLLPHLVFAQFTDLATDHDNFDAITYMKTASIVQGYDDGSFKPENKINRAELTKIIVSLNFEEEEIENCDKSTLGFSDVPANAWFAPFICTAKENGIVGGYEDGTFRPGNTINFVEASKIISGAFRPSLSNGSDIWYRPYIEYLARVKSLPTSITGFDHQVNRGEVSEIIYRLSQKIENKPSITWNEGTLKAPETPTKTIPVKDEAPIIETDNELPPEGETLPKKNLDEILQISNAQYKDLNVLDLSESIGKNKIALFFFANWCPSCKASHEEITNNISTFPNDTVIFKTEYDLETELKKKFGVTQQHTVVIINKENQVEQKLLGFTLDELREALK